MFLFSSYKEVSEIFSISLSLMKELDLYGFSIGSYSDGHKTYFYKNGYYFLALIKAGKIHVYRHFLILGYNVSVPILKINSIENIDKSFFLRLENSMKIPPKVINILLMKHYAYKSIIKLLNYELKKIIKLNQIPDKIIFPYGEVRIIVDFSTNTISELKD